MEALTPYTLADLTRTAAALATHAGQAIRTLRETGVTVAATKSSLVDVVTSADREAEQLLTQMLREARPDDALLGEEGTHTTGSSGITWVVDPIDGTTNYLYGLPGYAVSVAATITATDDTAKVMSDGRVAVSGAVYLPVTEELFTAQLGGGARLGGNPIHVSEQSELQLALVGTGFGYTVARRTEQAEVIRQIIPQVRDVRRLGAAAGDLCFVACGRLDGFYERGLQPWDYSAGALIAREAGAEVLALHDDEAPGTPMLITASPALARKLQHALQEAYLTLNSYPEGERAPFTSPQSPGS